MGFLCLHGHVTIRQEALFGPREAPIRFRIELTHDWWLYPPFLKSKGIRICKDLSFQQNDFQGLSEYVPVRGMGE